MLTLAFKRTASYLRQSIHYINFKQLSRPTEIPSTTHQWVATHSLGTAALISTPFKVDSYFPIIDQILSSMKTRIEAYNRLQRKFSFLMELNTMSNCKIEASAKKLLQYCPDDLEKSLPEEMIHFFTLTKQHHFNSECKEIQMFRFTNENEFMHAFPNISVAFRLWHIFV